MSKEEIEAKADEAIEMFYKIGNVLHDDAIQCAILMYEVRVKLLNELIAVDFTTVADEELDNSQSILENLKERV